MKACEDCCGQLCFLLLQLCIGHFSIGLYCVNHQDIVGLLKVCHTDRGENGYGTIVPTAV